VIPFAVLLEAFNLLLIALPLRDTVGWVECGVVGQFTLGG
jgi:hypothetical protein